MHDAHKVVGPTESNASWHHLHVVERVNTLSKSSAIHNIRSSVQCCGSLPPIQTRMKLPHILTLNSSASTNYLQASKETQGAREVVRCTPAAILCRVYPC